MIEIIHRVNKIENLEKIAFEKGVEIDIRGRGHKNITG